MWERKMHEEEGKGLLAEPSRMLQGHCSRTVV